MLTYSISHFKGLFIPEYPKNIKTVATESYALNSLDELVWCYFSSELGVFLRNTVTNITERVLTISSINRLSLEFNSLDDSYILFYNYKDRLYLKYFKDENYITVELTKIKTRSQVFMTYHELSDKIVLIYKDSETNLVSEVNSSDNFQTVYILKEDPIPKEEIVQVNFNSVDNLLGIDLVVTDNSLLKDIAIHPLIEDKTFRYIPIDPNMFETY